jgi:hypothetical protein
MKLSWMLIQLLYNVDQARGFKGSLTSKRTKNSSSLSLLDCVLLSWDCGSDASFLNDLAKRRPGTLPRKAFNGEVNMADERFGGIVRISNVS